MSTLGDLKSLLGRNQTWSLLSKDKLMKTLSANKHKYSRAVIDQLFGAKELHQVFKSRSNKPEWFRINARRDSFQVDVVLVPQYKVQNDNKDKFLFLIDILSRKAFAYVLNSGQMSDVIGQYEEFLSDVKYRRPVSVSGDHFFENREFKQVSSQQDIKVYTHVAEHNHAMRGGSRLGILDRAVRTLKMLIQKNMSETNNARWVDFLGDIIDLYNGTPHKALENRSPSQAYNDIPFLHSMFVRNRQYNHELKLKLNNNFKLGDKVRIATKKTSVFEKEGENFSRGVYRIVGTKGFGYIVQSDQGLDEPHAYLARDLQKVTSRELEKIRDATVHQAKEAARAARASMKGGASAADVPLPQVINRQEYYSIEAIKQHKRSNGKLQFLVKWLGYADSENSWLAAEQMQADMSLESYQGLVSAYEGSNPGAGAIRC